MIKPLISAVLVLALVATGGVGAQMPSIDAQRRRLVAAKQAAALASMRAERLLIAAAAETDAAGRAAAEERGLAERVAAAEAGLAAAEARAAIVGRLLAERRATLAEGQAPLARLLAALQSLTRRPAAVTLAQPGTVRDLVHLRAVLASVMPAIRARTAVVRTQVAETRALHDKAALARRALAQGRGRLVAERRALAAAEASHRSRAAQLGAGALSEADRALALGEQARDLVDRMAEEDAGQAVAAELARLPGPVARPVPDGGTMPPPGSGIYRMPVEGRLLTGFGEISSAGVRSRGLTFAVSPAALVSAPADGKVRYAEHFRGYGRIVIIDHGDGWTSLVTGLGTLDVVLGQTVVAGDQLGRAGAGEDARIVVELRRRGRPVDAAALVG